VYGFVEPVLYEHITKKALEFNVSSETVKKSVLSVGTYVQEDMS
jgi:hypothetical protein